MTKRDTEGSADMTMTAIAPLEKATAPTPGALASTGVPVLDERLGTLHRGRHYLFTGSPGSGKTTLALHFIGEGLRAGERCAILSQDDPDDLLTHADYIGYDLRAAIHAGQLVVLQFRMDFLRRYSRLMNPALVYDELAGMLSEEGEAPARLVIDSAAPFLEGGHVANDLIDGLGSFLERSEGITYVTIPGDIQERAQRRLYDRVVSSAAGVFHIERVKGMRRELSIQKLRQKATHTEPFVFEIRPGAGIEAWSAPDEEALPPEVRRRVLLLDEHGAIPESFRQAVGQSFEVGAYRSLENGVGEIAAGRYGALVIGIDPYRPNQAVDLAQSLRRSGNGAPIIFVAPREGLRNSTRARALRAGGDDFITTDASPVEVLERIDSASARGHRSAGRRRITEAPMQPLDDSGTPRPMTDAEFGDALAAIMRQPTPPLFAVLILRPTSGRDETWKVLRDQVRLEDGDLVAALEGDRLGVYLGHVDAGTAQELADRLGDAHRTPVDLLRFPDDRDRIEEMITGPRPTSHLHISD